MRIGLLGPLEVRDGDRVVDVSGARLRALLTQLALDAPRSVSQGALVAAVWGDDPPADETNALQSLVSRLRRALGDADLVKQLPGGYRLDVARDDVDIHRFAQLARVGRERLRAGDLEPAIDALRQARGMWRGPLAADLDGGFGAGVGTRLEEQQLDVLGDLAEAELLAGHALDALPDLEEMATASPLRERFTGLLMRALSATGRQADALERYENVRRMLADELGIDPSAELQAVHLGVLRGDFGTPVTPPAPEGGRRRAAHPASNLKAALTSFVGRDAEVARIAALLPESRLITLVGPGGAGKTRLATEALTGVLDRIPDGVWLTELAPITDPADVAQAVLSSLGGREPALLERRGTRPVRDTMTRLLDALTGRELLLVLDNCEHVVDAVAELADQLLTQRPHLRIVATSREPLGIFGETLVVVPPLAHPADVVSPTEALTHPAVRLFLDRAIAVDPGFAIDERTVAPVVEIVRRLDGLPLAIELAAARLRSLPVEEIAARLSDRFRLLTGGSRTAVARHRTLRAVVEWSWDLLTAAERTLMERLAVFAGAIDPDDAVAVCAGDVVAADDIDDLLASLVDKSLLHMGDDDTGPRYRMLETLREYGADRLAAQDQLVATRRRHAAHFADFVRTAEPHLRAAEQVAWIKRLESLRDEVLAALRFLGDDGQAQAALEVVVVLAVYWTMSDKHAEAANWTGLALAAKGQTDPVLRLGVEALHAVNSMIGSQHRSPAEVDAGMAQFRELSQRLDVADRHDPLLALMRPLLAMLCDDEERARRLTDEALTQPEPWVAATVRLFRAGIAENKGEVDEMRSDVEAALAAYRELGDRWGSATCLQLRAQLRTLDGDLDGAICDLEEALALSAELTDQGSISGLSDTLILQWRLAELLLRKGDRAGAAVWVDLASERTDAAINSPVGLLSRVIQAEFARHDGDLVRARKLRDEALGWLTQLPEVHPIQGHSNAMILAMAGTLSLQDGDLDAARDQLARSYRYAIGTKDAPMAASVGVAITMLAGALGRSVDAAEILGAAARLRGGDDPTQPDIAQLTHALRAALGAQEFTGAYERGRSLDRAAALARLDPVALDPVALDPAVLDPERLSSDRPKSG